VSSAAALAQAVAGDEPRVVEVAGTIALDGMVEVGSNKTIEAAADPTDPADAADPAGSAELVGGGLRIATADNVIVRNLTVTGSSGDDIGVEGSTDVWIDHNDLSAAAHAALGIGRGADRITVSWNHFHDQGDTAVLGYGDGDVTLDTGRLRVTYHHNWFDGTTRYNPRVRFGNPVHVVNNYFGGITSDGVASTSGAGVLVEANAFDDVDDPFHTGDGDSLPGALVARDNHLVGSGVGRTGGVVAPIPYDYTPDPATDVEALVTAYAGPRRPA
jgi:pectate lyase